MAPFNEDDWQITVAMIKRLEGQVSSLNRVVADLTSRVDLLEFRRRSA
jgi:hypothetical protein